VDEALLQAGSSRTIDPAHPEVAPAQQSVTPPDTTQNFAFQATESK
jgi:hypothetical protein